MADLKSTLKPPHGLASFNNKELYYIISNLFGLGAYGEGFIEKERLYLNFEKESYVRFLFICTIPILSGKQTQPETVIYYGEFDEDFEEIEIYGGSVPFEVSRADRKHQPDGFKFSELFSKSERIAIKPIRLVQGLLNIIDNSDIKTRRANDSFILGSDDKEPEFFHMRFNLFGNYDQDQDDLKNFSGLYHLVAKPLVTFESEHDKRGTLIIEYQLSDSDQYEIFTQEIDEKEMVRWESLYEYHSKQIRS